MPAAGLALIDFFPHPAVYPVDFFFIRKIFTPHRFVAG